MRSIVTTISAVAVAEAESVTVQRNVAVRASPADDSPDAENVVVALDGLLIVIVSPDSFVHAYEYPPAPPAAVAVTLAVVMVDVVPTLFSEVGDRLTDRPARVIVTDTSTVAVAAAESVTVQRNVAVRVSGSASEAAENVVVALEAESAVIDPPDSFVQA